MFVVNLAFSDMLMIITQGAPVVLNVFVSDFWMYGPLACKIYGLLGGITGKQKKCKSKWITKFTFS